MDAITIQEDKDSIVTYTPYHPDMVEGSNKLDGTFKGKAWHFSSDKKEDILELLDAVFGYTPETKHDLVNLEIHMATNAKLRAHKTSIIMGGREIARAFNRQSGAKLGADIEVIRGDFKSGGSFDAWTTESTPGVVFVIRNLYRRAAKNISLMHGWDINIAKVEIVEIEPKEPVHSATELDNPQSNDIELKLKESMEELVEVKSKINELSKRVDEIVEYQCELIAKLPLSQPTA